MNKILITSPKSYMCNKCHKITDHNVSNVCPTYKCEGSLIDMDMNKILNNHYYQLYNTLDIRGLRVVEHTAQLDKEKAYEYQKMFKNHEIDVLSCSTTFEMGVDVVTLETVFMRNMPPSTANYAQRAGRTGRSSNAAAYAITFCNKSNHDLNFFKTPEKMIKGNIAPPKFNIDNDKIAVRHLYASALSYFWKQHNEYFRDVSAMINNEEDNGFTKLCNYLYSKPKDLELFASAFLPKRLIDKFGIETYKWIDGLFK